MADIQRLKVALRNAHNAGDVEAARRLAAAIRSQSAAPAKALPDPASLTTETDAFDAAYLASRAGNADAAAAFRSRADEIRMSEMSGIDRFRAGFGKSIYDTGRGVGQLLGLTSQEDVDAAAASDAALMDTGAGIAGNIGGHLAQLFLPAGAVVKAGANAPRAANVARVVLNPRNAATATGAKGLAQTLGAAGAVGAGQAALQPVVSGDTRIGNAVQGFAFGAAGQGLGEGLGYAARGVIRAAAPGRQVQATAGDALRDAALDPEAVQGAIAAGRSGVLVPGSRPTLAEVTRDPGIAGLERALRTKTGFAAEFAERDAARNAARVAFIEQNFNGASREAADAIRAGVQEAQGPAIREAMRVTGAETGRVVSMLDRMARSPRFTTETPVQQALATVRGLLVSPIDDAGRLSAARGIANDAMAKPGRMAEADFEAVREAARLVRGAAQRGESSDAVLEQLKAIKPKGLTARAHIADMQRALRTAERGKPDVASLYNARKYITGKLMPRADGEQMFALRSVVSKLDETIGEVAPTYRQYLTDYAAGMRQADQASVGARLLESGRATASDPTARVQLGANTIRAASNPDQLVRGATGFSRARAERTLTPAQLQAIKAVETDLDRFRWMSQQSRASQNSITAEAMDGQNRLAQIATGVAAGSIPGGNVGVMAFDAILSQVGKKRGEAVQRVVAEALMDPERAAEILATLPVDVRREVIRIAGPTLGNLRAGSIAGLAGASSQRAAADSDRDRPAGQ